MYPYILTLRFSFGPMRSVYHDLPAPHFALRFSHRCTSYPYLYLYLYMYSVCCTSTHTRTCTCTCTCTRTCTYTCACTAPVPVTAEGVRALAPLTSLTDPDLESCFGVTNKETDEETDVLASLTTASYRCPPPHATHALRASIDAQEDRLGVEGRHSMWSCRTLFSLWEQCLSVTLARRLTCVIILRAQRDYHRM